MAAGAGKSYLWAWCPNVPQGTGAKVLHAELWVKWALSLWGLALLS